MEEMIKADLGEELEAAMEEKVNEQAEDFEEESAKETKTGRAWRVLGEMRDEKKAVTVRIEESVKGGVVTHLEGVRAFIPVSQLSNEYVEDTKEWVGKEVKAIVITADRKKNKLVLSAKRLLRDRRDEERNNRIAQMVPGTVLEGKVESIMPYGAFIDLGGGISGLVHISQISQRRIESVGEVLKEGQEVRVKVLNTNDNKVSLSMKALGEVSEKREDAPAEEYISNERASTSLGDLLSKIKL